MCDSKCQKFSRWHLNSTRNRHQAVLVCSRSIPRVLEIVLIDYLRNLPKLADLSECAPLSPESLTLSIHLPTKT